MLGEALQRIPGIQVNREADSRDATINLRGLPGLYAKTTLNGMDFATLVMGPLRCRCGRLRRRCQLRVEGGTGAQAKTGVLFASDIRQASNSTKAT